MSTENQGTESTAVRVITAITDLVKVLIPWTALTFMVYFLAGRDTNVLVNVFGNLSIDRYALILLGGSTTAWAMKERKLRRKAIERYSQRVLIEETKLNPNRQTSGLKPDGTQSEID